MNEVQAIALAYAPPPFLKALAALWDYDAALGRVVATTTEPMIGQMRLTWWYERMAGLDVGEVPREPLIDRLGAVVSDHDISGAMLAGLVDGWEVLLGPLPLSDEVLRDYARLRGDRLFELSGRVLGKNMPEGAGGMWALIDFATRCSDATTARRAHGLARATGADIAIGGPKPLRILAQLAKAKARQPIGKLSLPVSRWEMFRAVLP
jgi:15-cis-phytoene synthase